MAAVTVTEEPVVEERKGEEFTPEEEEKALEIFAEGKFLDYCHETFLMMWLGDVHVCDAVMLGAVNARITNTMSPLHLNFIGKTQVGKSDGAKAATQLCDRLDVLIASMSPQSIFYAEGKGLLHSGMSIVFDDLTMPPEMAAVYRNILTSWETGVDRYVVIQHKLTHIHVPRRITFIVTNVRGVVEDSDEGQDESRYIFIEITRDDKQIDDICRFIQVGQVIPEDRLRIIRAVWNNISRGGSVVKRHRIFERKKGETPRDFKRRLSIIMCYAALNAREETNEDDVKATDNFLLNTKIMRDSTTAAMSRNELAILTYLEAHPSAEHSLQMLGKACGMRPSSAKAALCGRNGTFENPTGGLLATENNVIAEKSDVGRRYTITLTKAGEREWQRA